MKPNQQQLNSCCCQTKAKAKEFVDRALQRKLTRKEGKQIALAITVLLLAILALQNRCVWRFVVWHPFITIFAAVVVSKAMAGIYRLTVHLKQRDQTIGDLQAEVKTLNFKIDQQNELFLKEISRLQNYVALKTSAQAS